MNPLRALLAALLACLIAGTPGLGLETRTGGSVLVGTLYAIPFLAAIAALVSTWRWPRAVRWLSLIAATSTVVLSSLDLLGLTDPERPATAIAVVEVAAIALALAIAVRTREGAQPRA
jgi:Kef-type K+ transport system membrane component KefB